MIKILNHWFNRYFGDEEAVVLTVVIALTLVVIWLLGDVLAPFFIALIVAYILQGPVIKLQNFGLSRLAAVIVTYLAFLGGMITIALFVVPLVMNEIALVLNDTPQILARGEALIGRVVETGSDVVGEGLIADAFAQLNQLILSNGERLLSYSLGQIPGLLTWIVYSALVLFMVFFFLKDWQVMIEYVRGALPTGRGAIRSIWQEMDQQLANYLRGKAIEIVIVAAASYVVFLFFGLRYSLLLAVLVGLSVLIPFVGAFSVTVPVALVALFQWGAEPITLYLILAYTILQIIDGNILVPILFSEAVNLHPVAIILAILVFGGIWGFWGVFLAIPLATLIKALLSTWPLLEQ